MKPVFISKWSQRNSQRAADTAAAISSQNNNNLQQPQSSMSQGRRFGNEVQNNCNGGSRFGLLSPQQKQPSASKHGASTSSFAMPTVFSRSSISQQSNGNNSHQTPSKQQRNSANPQLSTPGKGGRTSISRLTGDTISSSLKKRQQGYCANAKSVGFKEPQSSVGDQQQQFAAPTRGSYAQKRQGGIGFFASGKGVSPGKAMHQQQPSQQTSFGFRQPNLRSSSSQFSQQQSQSHNQVSTTAMMQAPPQQNQNFHNISALSNHIEMVQNTNFNLIELMRQQKASKRAAYLQEKALNNGHTPAVSAMTLTAQTSRVNSQISTPRLTPLRMIERNRNTDKNDISRLENKIKALESDITIAKQQGEEKRLDKLEMSLTNTSIPALNDNSLLDEEPISLVQESPSKMQKELLEKVAAVLISTENKKSENNNLQDSIMHEDELALLGDYDDQIKHQQTLQATETMKTAQDVIVEYDEYEKQLMNEICGMDTVLNKESLEMLERQNNSSGEQYIQNDAEYLQDAVQDLFTFIDSELEVPAQKQATLTAMKNNICALFPRSDNFAMQYMSNNLAAKKAGKTSRINKRVVQMPEVQLMESDDEDDSDAISSFEATPAFKKSQPKPMRVTRSQRKTTSKGGTTRKRTAKQALASLTNAEQEAMDADAANNQRALRSTKKRKLS